MLETIGQFFVILKVLGGFKDVINISMGGFAIITFIIFVMWAIVSFKKYNVFCLLDEVIHIRKYSLSKGEVLWITIANCIFLVLVLKHSCNHVARPSAVLVS